MQGLICKTTILRTIEAGTFGQQRRPLKKLFDFLSKRVFNIHINRNHIIHNAVHNVGRGINMLYLIGKEFSKPSQWVCDYLSHKQIDFNYIDLDHCDKDTAIKWGEFIAYQQIMALPVLYDGSHFCVGADVKAIELLIDLQAD